MGGTQKVDVGRRPFNTVGSYDEKGFRMEDFMRLQVRLFQFKQWFGGKDMFCSVWSAAQVSKRQAV